MVNGIRFISSQLEIASAGIEAFGTTADHSKIKAFQTQKLNPYLAQ